MACWNFNLYVLLEIDFFVSKQGCYKTFYNQGISSLFDAVGSYDQLLCLDICLNMVSFIGNIFRNILINIKIVILTFYIILRASHMIEPLEKTTAGQLAFYMSIE